MAIKKCFQCNKITYTPVHVTEISKDKAVYSYDLCKICGDELMKINIEKVDLSHIKTPEQLLEFMAAGIQKQKEPEKPPCPGCGLTIEEFDNKGRFGCSKCYTHFTERMEQLVFPYHKANCHVGKIPKKYLKELCNSSPEEKTKLLKLQLAKAVELEEYEKAAQIKIELDSLLQTPPSSSEGQ
jgi:protein arginine kinase activator